MQTDIQKIVSITGHSGLYRYLSQGRHGIIVESLKDGKRTCIPGSMKVSSLGEITVYTEVGNDLLLEEILVKIKEKTNGEQAISHRVPQEELLAYFENIVPEYDKQKVHPHHIKKMIEWYNILQEHDLLDFTSDKSDSELETDEHVAESESTD
jgi:hypothetical protein